MMQKQLELPLIQIDGEGRLRIDAGGMWFTALKDPRAREEFKALINAILDEREARARTRLLTDQEMADAIGCSLKTFRRRVKDNPDTLGRLARKPSPSAERWPREAVLDWWERNPAR